MSRATSSWSERTMARMKFFASRVLILALTFSVPAAALAQQRQGRAGGNPPERQQQQQQPEQRREAGPGVLRLLPGDSITEQSIDLANGQKLAYTATAGTLALYDQSG